MVTIDNPAGDDQIVGITRESTAGLTAPVRLSLARPRSQILHWPFGVCRRQRQDTQQRISFGRDMKSRRRFRWQQDAYN